MIERTEDQFWAYETNENNSKEDLVLLDNVQFIYELSLAKMLIVIIMLEAGHLQFYKKTG